MNTITPKENANLGHLVERVKDYVQHSKAPNTVRAYRADWQDWETWCAAHGVAAMPAAPESLAAYISELAEYYAPATIQRRLATISQAHRTAGHQSPCSHPLVRAAWQGILRTHGRPQQGKTPLLTRDVVAMVNTLPNTLQGLRDKALLLLGFAGAFRRSELVGLQVEDVEPSPMGLVVTIRRSKTDQQGAGQLVGIPYGQNPNTCPVRALQAWLAAAGITSGPIFRAMAKGGKVLPHAISSQVVALVVKRAARAAGLDASRYSGHSLRAGLATTAAMAGVPERAIMAQTRHRSVTVARRYIRLGSLWVENAAAAVGL
jgi:site-specific recombinase XerD